MLTYLRSLASHFAIAPPNKLVWPLLILILSLLSSCTRPAYYVIAEESALACAQPITLIPVLPSLIGLTPPADSLPATSETLVIKAHAQAVRKIHTQATKQPQVKNLLGQHLLRRSTNLLHVALRQQQPSASVAHPAGSKGLGLFFLVGGLAALLMGSAASANTIGALVGLPLILLGSILLAVGLIMLLTALVKGS